MEDGIPVGIFFFFFHVMGMSERGECSEAHSHQLDEEEYKDSHERDAFSPVVVRYRAREARVRQGVAGGSKEVDECGGYYDAGTKVFRNEECPFWNSYASMATRVDWEDGTCNRQIK